MKIINNLISHIRKIKLSRLEVKSGAAYDGSQKQNIVLSKLSLLVIVIASVHLIDDTIKINQGGDNYMWLSMVESMMILVSLITYILNENGKHAAAKHMLLFSFNILLFLLNTVAPKESGSYFFFFPLMSATFIFYGYSDEIKRYFYLGLTAAIFILLTVFDFDLFGIMIQMDTQYDFFTNLISSLILMVMTVGFLIDLNKRTESNLLDSQVTMKSLMDDLNEQNVNLEKVNTELDRFVYSVSHDLRAPLMSILGLINLSKMERSAERHQTYLTMMKEMVNKLDRFIHEVIDYTRNIKANIERREIDVKALVEEVVQDLKFMEGWSRIKFTIDVKLDEPFLSDVARVNTIIKNLITNSIKYHDFSKPDAYINVEVISEGGKKIIRISDNGQGIEMKFQEQVFDMFFRGTELSTGSGLGLYIVTEMVGKLGGELNLDSVLEKGTKITITF